MSPELETSTAVQEAAKDVTGIKDDVKLSDDGDAADIVDRATSRKSATIAKKHHIPRVSRAEFCDKLAASAQEQNLPLALFARLIWQESRFDPASVSSAGAQGVAQFMPSAAAEVGLKDPFNPLEALPAAARFLRGLFDRFGNLGVATAAYNAGPNRVAAWLAKGRTLPQETRSYVLRVTGKPAEQWRSADARQIDALPSDLPCRRGAFASLELAAPLETLSTGETRLGRVRVKAVHLTGLRLSHAARAAATMRVAINSRTRSAKRMHAALDVRSKSKSSARRIAAKHEARPTKVANRG